MSRTEKFRAQHRELEALVGQLLLMLDAKALGSDASAARTLLSQLAGKLNVHLAMEDSALYPKLLQHPKPEVQTKAKAFIQEMGGIKQVFVGYLGRWTSAAVIQASPQVFISETRELVQALDRRIKSEDADLYAMVDRLEA